MTIIFLIAIHSFRCYNASLLSAKEKKGMGVEMNFYQELQLNQAGSKAIIRQAKSAKEKAYHISVYLFKIFITMVFCVAFVTGYSKLFGSENSIVGVVILLCIMGFRFVNTGLKPSHGIIAMILIFIILAFGPRLANSGGFVLQFVVNLGSIFLLMLLGCHNVIFFNQSTLVLGYLLLFGYDVTGSAYRMRLLSIFIGAVMTILVYYHNHRNKQYKRTLLDLIKEFHIHSTRGRWQLAITLGVSLIIFVTGLLGFPRTMWVGIAAMSVIQPFHSDMNHRVTGRIWGNVLGGILFAVLYHIVPESYYFTFGIIGGVGVGLSASYGWQAVFNSLGAMTIAAEFLGWQGAIFYRILNNVCGALFGYVFFYLIGKMQEITIKDKN